MSKSLQRYRPTSPQLVRVPRVMFPKNTPSVYSTRLFFLLAYHSKFVDRLQIPIAELGQLLSIRNTHNLYDIAWWKEWLDDKHTSWLIAPILLITDDSIKGIPMVSEFDLDIKARVLYLTLNPRAREALRDLSGGFTGVKYQELLSIEHNKASLAYVLFSSLEHLNSYSMRTLSLADLTRALDLPDTTSDRKMQEIRRLAKVVQKSTTMKIEIETRKNGRNIEAVQFTIRRRIRIASKFKLRTS